MRLAMKLCMREHLLLIMFGPSRQMASHIILQRHSTLPVLGIITMGVLRYLTVVVVVLGMVELGLWEVAVHRRRHGSRRGQGDGWGSDGFKGQRVPLRWVEAVVY